MKLHLKFYLIILILVGNQVYAQNSFYIDVTKQKEAVLFPFDNYSIPFRHGLQLDLQQARKHGAVILPGNPGSPDSDAMAYYGTVIQIDDTLHMWYLGKPDGKPLKVCYAKSKDGFHWERPNLGLVEFNGDRNNNLVGLDFEGRMMSCNVIYEPDDPDPNRRFKIFCEVSSQTIPNQGCVAFSPDGLQWTSSPLNPVTHVRIEPTGLVKRDGCYYIVAQNAGWDRGYQKRVLISLASYDFEHWTDASVMGFRRDDFPPRPHLFNHEIGKQVHLGAGLWDRGNVVLGLYGQWNAPLETGDRREMRMDIGLLVSHDGIHYQEPIPDFKIIETHEEGWNGPNPLGDPPRFAQGQGIVNLGNQSITYYGIWGRGGDNSIRAASWKRDRFGYFSPTQTPMEGQRWVNEVKPHFISAPIIIPKTGAKLFLNASGISDHSILTVEILNKKFQPVKGYSKEECLAFDDNDFLRYPVRWKSRDIVTIPDEIIRVRVNFDGVRLEDARVFAVYVERE